MPDDRKKMYSKQSTGTVPKTKHRNNTAFVNHDNFQRNLSNNLGLDWQRQDYSNYSRNSERNLYHLPYTMDGAFSDHRQNPVSQINLSANTANGTLSTSSTSGSNSRRDSVGTIPKCDNVKKCPDKKQIEDKLNQIREYLQVTTSLMTSIKNEDQSAVNELENFKKMIKDLKDSEGKLLALLDDPLYDESSDLPSLPNVSEHLENGMDNGSETSASGYQRNELEEKVELTNRKVQLLREQQNALINLKRKAENQLRDARQAQENLLLMQQQQQQKAENRSHNPQLNREQAISNEILVNDKNLTENPFDVTIKELENRLDSMRNDSRQPVVNSHQDNSLDYLQEQLNTNNQLLHLLDNRDTHLNSEHMELQQKLNDLQGKKMQIDQLTQQLQNLGEEDDEDIGNQVRKIVTMKQQLSSLKDLLEVVKNTEFSLLDSQNVNDVDSESQEASHSGSIKRDNIRQNVRLNQNQNDHTRVENNRARVNEQWTTEKQSNKSIGNIKEREKVLAELKSKKRELEEIMYKQKDRTSINNDVCSETSMNKSDVGTNNMYDNVVMSWLPVHPYQHNQVASVYSSDECAEEDINEYSELNFAPDLPIGVVPPPQPVLTTNYSVPFTKRAESNQPFDGRREGSFLPQNSARTTEPCIPTGSTTTPSVEQERPLPNCSNETETTKAQLQKQLELIQCFCQSLLDHQASNSNTSNVHHLRNNLTPSPMYAEPKHFISANSRQSSALNAVNPNVDIPYFNNPNPINYYPFGEVANNHNMLAANTLQTQAFLLNTLNQCCQMLWFQQREIASLRSMICSMQDQMMHGQNDQEISSIPLPPTSYVFPTRPASSMSNFRPSSQPRHANPKINLVSAACSLPNLNPSTLHANVDNAYLNQNNVRSSPSARLLESSLNNTTPIHSHLNLSGDTPANNTILPSVNVNTGIVQPIPSQIWNGQALNNQVPPGNRANNYWDNFRSYSRQNLLSTSSKSNEGLQTGAAILERRNGSFFENRNSVLETQNSVSENRNSVSENRNSVLDRTKILHGISLRPFSPKLNLVHNESTNTSEEGTPRRSRLNKPVATIPPDVLNINHNSNQKRSEHHNSATMALDLNFPENNLQLDRNNSPNDRRFKDYSLNGHRNRNEWHENEQNDSLPKSKLFEELRENVYREVANLISANENRPHFLIQLFRDLQQVNSDTLRGRTLQSIQTLLTSALESMRGTSRQSGAQAHHVDQEGAQANLDEFPIPQTLWNQSLSSTPQNNSNVELENTEDPDIHNILKMSFSFLKSHNDQILQTELIEILKDIIIKAMPFTQMFANTNLQERTFHKHFVNILNEAFEKYQGRRISEIKKDLLKTISDVLVGEFSFIYLVQENIPDNCENITSQCNNSTINDNQLSLNLQSQPMLQIAEEGNTPQMQNGDLAEADQSHLELLDEEGAVGGVLNCMVEAGSMNSSTVTLETNGEEITVMEFPQSTESDVEFVEQGLDQVPTRLTTGSRPHSNTPSRDRSATSRSDHSDHF